MWLITPTGFYSIVEKPPDSRTDKLTIRARVKSDLIALRQEFLPSLGKVRESMDTDYRYRATAPREEVGQALSRMVSRLNYANFKSEVAVRQGLDRAHVYHDVWEVLHGMQDDPRFELRALSHGGRK